MTLSYQNVTANISFSQKIADIKLQIEKIDRQIEQIKLQSSLLPLNQILLGDCYDVLKTFPDNSIDCVVTDPPYSLGRVKDVAKLINAWMSGEDGIEHHSKGFMGKDWDVIPSPKTWKEVYKVLKPGGYALVFAGTRTVDLMGLGLRLAGFEISESISWIFGSGFPKSKKMLKPAFEPILVCYKPGKRADLNIDECRITGVANDSNDRRSKSIKGKIPANGFFDSLTGPGKGFRASSGRYPSNFLLSHSAGCVPPDGTEENPAYLCTEDCPIRLLDEITAHIQKPGGISKSSNTLFGQGTKIQTRGNPYKETDGTANASRFFLNLPPENPFVYSPKASKSDRTCGEKVENTHVTVKPTQLIQYLVKLVCPENGVVLDPFIGSGTTALACIKENRYYIGIEREREYFDIALERIKHCS